MNWLANLSGNQDGWKEMDLLQEHQNFWAKVRSFRCLQNSQLCSLLTVLQVIYSARGSNRTWDWLAMVSVVIFTLRDVIRQVQKEFKVPYNGTSHTSPSAAADIHTLCKYLESRELQQYKPARKDNQYATPSRDLFAAGAEYANKASAFKTFTRDTRAAINKGARKSQPFAEGNHESDIETDNEADHDLRADPEVELDDLAMDEEEFPCGMDPEDFAEITREFIHEMVLNLLVLEGSTLLTHNFLQ